MTRISNPFTSNISSGTNSGTVSWGSITGTLSNQTDLQNALNAKLGTTGGTVSGSFMISGSNTSDFQGLTLNNGDNTAFNLNSLIFQGSSQNAFSKISHMIYSGGSSADLRFYLSNAGVNSAAIVFEHHGRIGIGVTSPSATLHLLDFQITEHISGDLFSDGIRMYKRGNNGTAGTSGAVLNTSEIGYHSFYGWDGSAYGRAAYALVTATENFGTAGHGAQYEIYTTPNTTTSGISRFKIANDGTITISIGLITPQIQGSAGGAQYPQVYGEYNNGTASGSIGIDWSKGDHQALVVNGAGTLHYSNAQQGETLTMRIVQGTAGGNAITLPTSLWPNGTATSFGTTANAINLMAVYYDGTNYLTQLAPSFA